MTSRFLISLALCLSLTACPSAGGNDDEGSSNADTDAALYCDPPECVQACESVNSFECELMCTPRVDSCEGEQLCPLFTVYLTSYVGGVATDSIDDPDAARCFLAALRDRTPGRLQMIWGDPKGVGQDGSRSWNAQIYSPGDGTVAISAVMGGVDASGSLNAPFVTEAMILQDPSYFESCAVEQDEATLITCLSTAPFLSNLDTLPWLTGECTTFAGCG
ncbi:MAG: hypothetical protein KC457_19540 [Myxococcales bacterium]|nr:hypothetical protein [Myxococcales bacterium]